MGIVCAHIVALVSHKFLEPHPNVRLDVFNKVADMDRAVGIGQGRSHKYFSHSGEQYSVGNSGFKGRSPLNP